MDFQLDNRLAEMSVLAATIDDLQVRLVNDSRYYWLMIVPALPNIIEIDDLPTDTAARMFHLAGDLSAWLKTAAQADKINSALIGNVVPQMHFHIVARHLGDQHWPDPIWGRGAPEPLTADALETRRQDIAAFALNWTV